MDYKEEFKQEVYVTTEKADDFLKKISNEEQMQILDMLTDPQEQYRLEDVIREIIRKKEINLDPAELRNEFGLMDIERRNHFSR